MKPEDLHRLVEEYRDGTISDADARALAEAIRRDPAVAAAVHRARAFSGQLGQAVDAAEDEVFARSFAERLQAERGRTEFVRAFEKRSSRLAGRSRRVRTPRTSLIPFLVAAGLILAALAWLTFRAERTETKEVVRKAPAPPVEAPRAPEPEPRPTPQPEPPTRAPEPPKLIVPVPPAPQPPKPPEPVPAPAPDPIKRPEESKPAPTKTAVAPSTAVAKLDRVEGDVHILVDGERKPAKAGQELQASTGVATGPGKSGASVLLADGTRFSIGPDATLKDIAKGARGTKVTLTLGTIVADVAKQPTDQPLVFATPHAEARVLGTVLHLVVAPAQTRLEVKEGKVRLTRDAKSVDVAAGQYAVAGAATPLAAHSLSPDEIVLYPQEAKLTGGEWSLQRDLKSLTGVILEAGTTAFKQADHVETRPSYATYTFFAPADKEYRIWMRLTSQEKGDPWTRDIVTFEPLRVTMSQKSAFFGAAPTTAWVVTGVSVTPGYTWISATGEAGKAEPPLTMKFHETGFQTLRLYVVHPWVRVDAIWLSATQKTRPPFKQLPPQEK
jgi:ferric-dicitrate binding protein FerR (iron transport regulator)